MSLDPTISESAISRSIKKLFWDGLYTAYGTYVSFDATTSPPQDTSITEWINVDIGGIRPKQISTSTMHIYVLAIQDLEGVKLDELVDQVYELLYDGYFPIYDSSFTAINTGMQISIENSLREPFAKDDKTKLRYIIATLRWGAKW